MLRARLGEDRRGDGHRGGDRGGDEDELGVETLADLVDRADLEGPLGLLGVSVVAGDVPPAAAQPGAERAADQPGADDKRATGRSAGRMMILPT